MKLERQANLCNNGNTNENGKYDANSITMTFSMIHLMCSRQI